MTTQLITASYSDAINVNFTSDAWINATATATHFQKEAKYWLGMKETAEYVCNLANLLIHNNCDFVQQFNEINSLDIEGNSPALKAKFSKLVKSTGLITTKQGSAENGGGTWLHPKLAVPFARWLDVGFSIWCDMQIEKILHPQPLENPKHLESPTITKAQQGELFTRAKHIAGESGKIRAAIWSRFQNHFHLSSYKDLPGAQYEEALTYLDRLQHEYNNGVEMLYISNLELEALIQDRVKALPAPTPSHVKEGELLARIESLLESAPTPKRL